MDLIRGRRTCPRCGALYQRPGAISRLDSKELCPTCGVLEAVEIWLANR